MIFFKKKKKARDSYADQEGRKHIPLNDWTVTGNWKRIKRKKKLTDLDDFAEKRGRN